MDDDTIVYVWHDGSGWEATPAYDVVCPNCGRCLRLGEDDMWWEIVIAGEPHIACACGEQFSTTHPDH